MDEAEVLHAPLSEQRARILVAIHDWHDAYGYAPSARELCREVNLAAVSTVHAHLKILREQGYITWVQELPRTLHVTEKGGNAVANLL